MPIRVLLVDDHRLMLDGLRSLLERADDIEVMGEAEDGRKALEAARELRPDVIVLDLAMPEMNGLTAIRSIRRQLPECKITMLSAYADRRHVEEALDAGAHAYVRKIDAYEDLVLAIRSTMRGDRFVGPEIRDLLDAPAHGPGQPSARRNLSPREQEVLQLVAEGRASGEIASLLGISTRTVEAHRQNVMSKLDLHSVAELTKFALREGLTTLED